MCALVDENARHGYNEWTKVNSVIIKEGGYNYNAKL